MASPASLASPARATLRSPAPHLPRAHGSGADTCPGGSLPPVSLLRSYRSQDVGWPWRSCSGLIMVRVVVAPGSEMTPRPGVASTALPRRPTPAARTHVEPRQDIMPLLRYQLRI
ncbi:hypothetical protein PVAP13_3NG273075 [Panicum virgatum]|uniref:Uncharacterized protein n=1 Tax=Panicum virgatum TaxID=38727 RepID=A0A8T0UPM6_PANVG|nr:hypothetical protein PVAP13_3NG273075 [Panicum virgatum]